MPFIFIYNQQWCITCAYGPHTGWSLCTGGPPQQEHWIISQMTGASNILWSYEIFSRSGLITGTILFYPQHSNTITNYQIQIVTGLQNHIMIKFDMLTNTLHEIPTSHHSTSVWHREFLAQNIKPSSTSSQEPGLAREGKTCVLLWWQHNCATTSSFHTVGFFIPTCYHYEYTAFIYIVYLQILYTETLRLDGIWFWNSQLPSWPTNIF